MSDKVPLGATDLSAEAEFWTWFQANEDAQFHFERDQEPTFDRLATALNRVDDSLTFEFSPMRDGCREFVISAAGIKSAFPSVERLVAAQPQLERFQVLAFRPRRPEINDIEYADLKIAADDVYYRFAKDVDPAKVGVLLFLPGYDTNRQTEFGQVGYLFLDEALGEYDVEMRIGFIEMMGYDSRYFEGAQPIAKMGDDFEAIMRARSGP